MPVTTHLNAVGTAIPDHDIHQSFIDWARSQIATDRGKRVFDRMAGRSGINHRWSVLPRTQTGLSPVEAGGFYDCSPLPGTADRMALYARFAPELAIAAIDNLRSKAALEDITHMVVASCTGFVAPGIDQIIARRIGLAASVERLLIGFMGCYAAIAALRSARHIVRSDPKARVLVLTVELSTLHLQETDNLESLLAMLQFGDGAAASIVTADASGFVLGQPFATTLPDSEDLIRWNITDRGFAMYLSGEVPGRIAAGLGDPDFVRAVTGGRPAAQIDQWAVHAGGRSILDAVEQALDIDHDRLAISRSVLQDFGNMSSTTLMIALERLMNGPSVDNGVALAFGPGLAAEGFGFSSAL